MGILEDIQDAIVSVRASGSEPAEVQVRRREYDKAVAILAQWERRQLGNLDVPNSGMNATFYISGVRLVVGDFDNSPNAIWAVVK